MQNMVEFFAKHETQLNWLGWISILTFLVSLALMPWLVCKIPVDYFSRATPDNSDKVPTMRYLLVSAMRNFCALLLFIAGLVMLILPGQGLLTMMVSLFVAKFPGKHCLERRLVAVPSVFQAINWMRERRNAPPLRHPNSD